MDIYQYQTKVKWVWVFPRLYNVWNVRLRTQQMTSSANHVETSWLLVQLMTHKMKLEIMDLFIMDIEEVDIFTLIFSNLEDLFYFISLNKRIKYTTLFLCY